MPDKHAFLSPSSAERWMNCTAAPLFEKDFPGGTSKYAEAGTVAHSVCELRGKRKFRIIDQKTYNAEMRKVKKSEYYDDKMIETADFYVEYLKQISMDLFDEDPYVAFEVSGIDLSEWVPESFGTCDCVMIGGDRLHITDYKNGVGVPVSSERNVQMMLYSLGALRRYQMFYPSVSVISYAIVQPNLTRDVQRYEITLEDLFVWGESVKPIAQAAFTGDGAEFRPGDWCRFCKGKAACRKRAEQNSAFADFIGVVPPPKGQPAKLSNVEIGELLNKAKDLQMWYSDLSDYARSLLIAGETVPGFKLVEGRGSREFNDQKATFQQLKLLGYQEEDLYTRKAKSVAQIESLMGKKIFAEKMDGQWKRIPGKPTLVEESDSREEYSSAKADFSGVV